MYREDDDIFEGENEFEKLLEEDAKLEAEERRLDAMFDERFNNSLENNNGI
jgi:hypothetical protein